MQVRHYDPSKVHNFEILDRYFMVDILGSKFYQISPICYLLLKNEINIHELCDKYPKHLITEAQEELNQLYDSIAEQDFSAQEHPVMENEVPRIVSTLWLGISHKCNLNCAYCFANEPRYVGEKQLMSKDTARQAVDFLISHSGDEEELGIIFFGGEPLLNLPVIKATIDYSQKRGKKKGKRFVFSMTTNGILLTPEVFRYLIDKNVSVMVSLDGTKSIHDRYRPFPDGSGSWDIIWKNLNAIKDFNKYLTVRVTVTSTETDLLTIYQNLSEAGLHSFYFTEVCPNSGAVPVFNDDQISILIRQYTELTDYLLGNCSELSDVRLNTLNVVISQILRPVRRYFCCNSGIHSFYVTPTGDFIPCARLLSDGDRYHIGNLNGGIDYERLLPFYQNNVLNKLPCQQCWARFICGGQCFGDCFVATGMLNKSDPGVCRLIKHKMKCAAALMGKIGGQAALIEKELAC